MKKKLVGIVFMLLVLCLALFVLGKGSQISKHETLDFYQQKLSREREVLARINLVDPNQAPHSIKAHAMRGYEIIIDTQKHAKEYVGSKLNCTNCHFAAGDTKGGAGGSISLVGVAAKYPSYNEAAGEVIDLASRINSCFTKSLNGKALPCDSQEMLSLLTYLQWISKDIPIYRDVPWLGLKMLKTKHKPSDVNGKKVYEIYCALCHRDDGQGGENVPPLWGDFSFNDAAGLGNVKMLASFIYWNMPYLDISPTLSEGQAMDVAAYILSQPRPSYKKDAP
jgi:thiosulfate dehydrogenase